MNCPKCGAPLEADARFCESCGANVANLAQDAAKNEQAAPANDYKPSGDFGQPEGGYQPQGNFETNQSGSQFNQSHVAHADDVEILADLPTRKIRKWFNAKFPIKRCILAIILIISAFSFARVSGGMAAFFFLLALVLIAWAVWKIIGNTVVKPVDDAWNLLSDIMVKRGFGKLSLTTDETNLIDPVVVIGFGNTPNATYGAAENKFGNRGLQHLYKKYRNGLISFINLFLTEKIVLDPEESLRVGMDGLVRSQLMQVSVYWFTENELLCYSGNVDISTGLVYQEATREAFYEDIETVNFGEELYKAYHPRKIRRVSKKMETLNLTMAGTSWTTNIFMPVAKSALREQFSAMRNLIRDKKNNS